jgi:hypothetical protein
MLDNVQTRQLFLELSDHISDVHLDKLKKDLSEVTHDRRMNREKGVLMLHFKSIKDMILCIKKEVFLYQWVTKSEANGYKHNGIDAALNEMNPSTECILVCSIEISKKHMCMSCYRIKL